VSSQNDEDQIVSGYFEQGERRFVGRFLDIGAYDGVSCSNTLALIKAGWSGVMVEGSTAAFQALLLAHGKNPSLTLVHAVMAVGQTGKLVEWWENSEALEGELKGRAHPGMASTTVKEQYQRVMEFTPDRDDAWNKFFVPSLTPCSLIDAFPGPYDFVTIDTEGTSLDLLAETDLESLEVKVVCVEHNAESGYAWRSGPDERARAIRQLSVQGFTEVLFDNGVNIICGRLGG